MGRTSIFPRACDFLLFKFVLAALKYIFSQVENPVKDTAAIPPRCKRLVLSSSTRRRLRASVSQSIPPFPSSLALVQGICKHCTTLDGEQLRSANFPLQTSMPPPLLPSSPLPPPRRHQLRPPPFPPISDEKSKGPRMISQPTNRVGPLTHLRF